MLSSAGWMLVKLFKRKTPVLATFHSQCYYNEKWGWFAKSYLRLGEYMACRQADRVITVSKALTKYVNDKYPQARVAYIPNGVNMPQILAPQEITTKWNLTKDSYILSVGRLVRNKGLEYLIKAYQNTSTEKKLVIVGEGLLEAELKALANNNPNIVFTGNQIGQTLEELFSNACLFVQPSESEGLSLSLLEAMSYKNACLVSNIPANLEAVGEDGLTFKSQDTDELKNKLQELLDNQDRLNDNKEEMYKKVVQDYNWRDLTDELVQLYKEIIELKHK